MMAKHSSKSEQYCLNSISGGMLMKKIILLFVLSIGIQFLAGCSAIGLGVGSIIDHSSSPRVNISPLEIGKYPDTDSVAVFLRNGDTLYGKYLGLSDIWQSDYNSLYDQEFEKGLKGKGMPAIGDTIQLKKKIGSPRNLQFLGFGYQYRRNQYDGKKNGSDDNIYLLASPVGEQKAARIFLGNVDRHLLANNSKIPINSIKILIASGEIPLMTQAKIQSGDKLNMLALQNISRAELPRMKTAKREYFRMGLYLDIAAIAILAVISMGVVNNGIVDLN
jgi:hypothetical protein